MKQSVLVIVLIGCVDNGAVVRDPLPTANCASACARLDECGREEAQPAEDGTTCAQLCEEVQNLGIPAIDPECVVAAKTCSDIDRCPGFSGLP
jgi:hypothetical protein